MDQADLHEEDTHPGAIRKEQRAQGGTIQAGYQDATEGTLLWFAREQEITFDFE